LKTIDYRKISKFVSNEEQKCESKLQNFDDQVPNKEDNKSGDDECYAAKEELENHDSNEVDGEDDEQFSSDDDADGSEKGDSSTRIKDPFKVHFENDITDEFVAALQKGEMNRSQKVVSGFGIYESVQPIIDTPTSLSLSKQSISTLGNAKVREKIIDRWNKVNKKGKEEGDFTPLQRSLFKHINSYQDVFYSQRTFENGEEIRRLYCLHAVNHVLKTRSRILKNNARIAQMQKEKLDVPEFRDQGLTRPKVLILAPFRDSALRIVNLIIQLSLPIDEKAQVMKKKRFYEEFKDSSEPEKSPRYMPSDFKAMFHGNSDDCFRVGITVMRRALKLYSDFYSSDIIIASPLGIRTIIGAEGDKKRDFDFLSSIEVVILDQTDVFLMQNWEHVLDIFDHLNIKPKQVGDTDFSRVRMWTLNFWSKFYRQTLIFSSFITPEMNSLFNKHCHNYSGKVRIKPLSYSGSVRQIVSQIPQVLHRIDCQSVTSEADKRFEYFVTKVLPEFKNPLNKNTAIFIPSYFDFIRIRNFFKKEELNFLQINEYSERSNISRARTKFLENRSHFLLFTERFYFFYRYRIRGIKNIIFYQLPLYPVFYPEIINFMEANADAGLATNSLCSIIYSKYDRNRLENIIGTQQCKQVFTSTKNIHMIVTGS